MNTQSASDTDTDSDTDADSDTDSDTDADSDTDSDSDSDTDADSDADSDSDSGSDTDADPDTDDCEESKLPDMTSYFDFFEFCVDNRPEYLSRVHEILEPLGTDGYSWATGSAGLIKCDTGSQYLFWDIPKQTPRDILCQLTLLPFIERIGTSVYL